MAVKIGHASIDEHGRAHGGAAGDQTGREVCIRDWWAGGWDVLLRPRDPAVAEKAAAACEALCASGLVGYDQYQRNSLWDELEKVGWAPGKLAVKCETDCSAFVTACVRCAGIGVPRVKLAGGGWNAPVTGTMRTAFGGTGAFEVITDRAYLGSDALLRRGDILVRSAGHTVMVLSDGDGAPGSSRPTDGGSSGAGLEAAQYHDKALEGTYSCTAFALNVRAGAGVSKQLLGNLRKGETVTCTGDYSTVGTVRWLVVRTEKGKVGFASERYLRREA